VALLHNQSEQFECRWATVKIPSNRSVMLGSIKDLILGCWVAHGEGRFAFREEKLISVLQSAELVTLQYVDDTGEPTELYPLNPNGSPRGIAGLCSTDGRHLGLMPHPERCSAMNQWPYVPPSFEVSPKQAESPWQIMFNNDTICVLIRIHKNPTGKRKIYILQNTNLSTNFIHNTFNTCKLFTPNKCT